LALGLRGADLTVPGLSARSVEVFAWLRWPLERRSPGALALSSGLSGLRRQRAEAAAALARKLAETAARSGGTLREGIDRQLDEEEARAELAAVGCP
jgi:hypothetical protein